jgi:hypothetical protein
MTVFETTTCTRCGGGGRYSFNLMHGDRCYGCGGTGVKLTKRGAAASAFFRASQEMPVADLKVGMYVWDTAWGKKAKFLPVLSIKQSGCYTIVNGQPVHYIDVETERGGCGFFPDGTVRAVRDEAHRKALLEAALAFQATLTQAGKPSKRKGATA